MAETTTYPRLPELPARQPEETAEAYGLRALAFVVATNITATLDDDALQLADHVFAVAVSNRELSATVAESLARSQSLIRATLRSRAVPVTGEPVAASATPGRPMIGPGAPLRPTPNVQPPAGSTAEPARPQPQPREAFAF